MVIVIVVGFGRRCLLNRLVCSLRLRWLFLGILCVLLLTLFDVLGV